MKLTWIRNLLFFKYFVAFEFLFWWISRVSKSYSIVYLFLFCWSWILSILLTFQAPYLQLKIRILTHLFIKSNFLYYRWWLLNSKIYCKTLNWATKKVACCIHWLQVVNQRRKTRFWFFFVLQTVQMLKQTCTMLEGQVEELEVMNDEYQDREATWNLIK